MHERDGAEVLSVPPPRRGRLFRKYVVIFVVLVSGALLTSGVVEAYFVYEENQAAVIRLQRERAVAAASTIEQFLGEAERQLGWVVLSPSIGPPSTEQRRSDYDRLLQLAPSVEHVSYLDAAGVEQVRVSRPASGGPQTRADYSQEAWVLEARSRGVAFGPVGVRDGAAPVLPIALAERGPSAGVVVALLSLEPVREVIAQASVSETE